VGGGAWRVRWAVGRVRWAVGRWLRVACCALRAARCVLRANRPCRAQPLPPKCTMVVDVDGEVVVVVVDDVVVVVEVEPVDDVDDVGAVVEVVDDVVDDVVDEVVVFGTCGSVVTGAVVGTVLGEGATTLPTDVPPFTELVPISEDSGRPAISSMPVTTRSATTKTATTITASGSHRTLPPVRRASNVLPALPLALVRGCLDEPARTGYAAGLPGARLDETRRGSAAAAASVPAPAAMSAATASVRAPAAMSAAAASVPAPATMSPATPSVPVAVAASAAAGWSPLPDPPVTGDPSTVLLAVPADPVVPEPPSNGSRPGTFTATCLTAPCARSIDWTIKVVAVVATTLPSATPMIVPFSPKTDAITAEATAPDAEAAICFGLSFMVDRSVHVDRRVDG